DVRPLEIDLREGRLTIVGAGVPASERPKLVAVLSGIEGIDSVAFVAEDEAIREPDATRGGHTAVALTRRDESGFDFLPRTDLFDPLLADPRWPHFSASFQYYLDDDEIGRIAAVSFGETIPILHHDAWGEGRVGLSLHAAVFSIFDIDAESFDLVNSDFMVGPAVTWRSGDGSAFVRLFHQSSHLGDEFLLRNRVDRINLSYEAVDALVSWDAMDGLRVYAGGGWLLRREPGDLERGSLQAGFEFQSPRTFLGGVVRPIAAVDLQGRQEHDWDVEISARAGIQLESPRLLSQRLQILLDYYQGQSPNGQFFEREIEYFSLGAHLHF
ncbi:MAG: DUF1207 domain-containing protein, partial [Myxococcales bacterium]|nr:DUF1207 domain-containing protein [Myxococcales bacterium]